MALFDANSAFSGNFGGADFSANFNVPTNPIMSIVNATPSSLTATATPTKALQTSVNKNVERTTNTQGTRNTRTTGSSQDRQIRDTQSVTDPVLQAIDAAVRGNSNQETLVATDEARRKTMEAIMAAIQGFDADAIQQGARGDVDQLTRQLMEDVLPQVTGAVEASGSSNNALGALLAQDAASRTSEAQARVQEMARANAQQEFLGMIQQATGASGRGSAVADNLNALINAAKGTVDRGTIINNKTFTQNEDVISAQQEAMREGTAQVGQENTFGDGTASGSLSGSASGDADRMAKLALLQSTLSPFQSLQELGGARMFGSQADRDSANSIQKLATILGI